MQAASDIFLGWIRVKGMDGINRNYYVRQLHDWKGSAEVESMLVPGANAYAQLCGATLARAHGRWGDRIAIASYLGAGDRFNCAIADFADAYGDQNDQLEAFEQSVKIKTSSPRPACSRPRRAWAAELLVLADDQIAVA